MKQLLIIFISLTLISCMKNNDNSKDRNKSKDETILINVESSKSYIGNAQATFKSTAILEADRAAIVTTKSSGIILDILVEEGDAVKKDDVLLILESDEQELSLKSAEANYAKSLNNYERALKLIEKGLTNQEQIDNLKYETKVLKSSLDQAKMNLSFTQVKAPFDGMVTKRLVKIGNLVQNSTAVFEVIDFNSLQAKIDVPEHRWSIMKKGLPVQFDFDAIDESVYGEIERVSPVIDSNSGTFNVTVTVSNNDNKLRPGLFAKANVIFDKRTDVVLVDKDAILREDELTYVFLVKDTNKVLKQEVKVGYEMPDSFEIISGLKADQEVVTTGKNNLSTESEINVVNYSINP